MKMKHKTGHKGHHPHGHHKPEHHRHGKHGGPPGKGPRPDAYITEYLQATTLRMPDGLAELMAATDEAVAFNISTRPLQGQLLAFLMKSIGAKRAIEVGVFTGQGTLWMADAVGPQGQVIACDVTDEYPAIGQPHWQAAGVADRIDLRIAPADQTLQALLDAGESEAFDFCYIDADKESYDTYYQLAVQLVRPGGMIAMDNMMRGGRVADPDNDEPDVTVIRYLNATIPDDPRVESCLLPLFDGVHLVRKR